MEAEKPAGKRLRAKYDAAFRAEAIRRVNQDGQAATRVAQALGMSAALPGCKRPALRAVGPCGRNAWRKRPPTAAVQPALAAWQVAAQRVKTELLPRGACFADLEKARLELAEHFDHYYNTRRLHSALGYGTPLDIELHYRLNLNLP